MTVRFSRQRRYTLCLLCTLVTSVLPIVATAGDFDCGSDFTLDAVAPCEIELAGTEELCGWLELGTHDSGAVPTLAAREPDTATNGSIDSSIAAIAVAACGSAGVSVEQIVEPFAMVGPYVDDSLSMVSEFQKWWKLAVAESQKLQAAGVETKPVESIDIQPDLDAIAVQEPTDFESLGPSVLVGGLPESNPVQPGIEITAINPLVGGSAMIATIEENYLPYDLSVRDIQLWSEFPVATHPFCVRSRAEQVNGSPMWQDFDNLVSNETNLQEPSDPRGTDNSLLVCGSADCLLDEWIWHVQTWTAEDSPVWPAVDPHNLGRQLQALANDGHRLVIEAAHLLASSWPDVEPRVEPRVEPQEEPRVEPRVEPSPAGEALLARAGAIEASEPANSIVEMSAQIAEVPVGTRLR